MKGLQWHEWPATLRAAIEGSPPPCILLSLRLCVVSDYCHCCHGIKRPRGQSCRMAFISLNFPNKNFFVLNKNSINTQTSCILITKSIMNRKSLTYIKLCIYRQFRDVYCVSRKIKYCEIRCN